MFWLFNPPEPCANPATSQDRRKFATGKSRFEAVAGSGAGHCTAVPDIWQIAPEPGSTGTRQNLFPGGRSLCRRVHNDHLTSWQSGHVGVSGYTQQWDLYHGAIILGKHPPVQWFLGLFVVSDILNAPHVSWFWALPLAEATTRVKKVHTFERLADGYLVENAVGLECPIRIREEHVGIDNHQAIDIVRQSTHGLIEQSFFLPQAVPLSITHDSPIGGSVGGLP